MNLFRKNSGFARRMVQESVVGRVISAKFRYFRGGMMVREMRWSEIAVYSDAVE